MRAVFDPDQNLDFVIFSYDHLIMIIALVVLIIGLIVFRKHLRNHSQVQRRIRWSLFTILVFSELSYQAWSFANGIWDARWFLPLQLCSLSSFVVLFFLWKPTSARFQLVYFIALLPPFLAILTPDLLYSSPHYRFWQFFIHHIALILVVFYYLIVEKYRPKFRSIFIAFLFVNLLAIPIHFVNKAIGSNYMFLEGAPASDTLLSYFGSGISYLIQLELVMLVAFFLTYLPYIRRRSKRASAYEHKDFSA